MENLISVLIGYVTGLDWTYIMTFILLAYLVNSIRIGWEWHWLSGIKIRTRFKVAVIGIAWATLVYLMRGRSPGLAESLINSFVFAIVFHKIILDTVIQYFKPKWEEEPDHTDPPL